MTVKIIIVDDHPVTRKGLARLLADKNDLEVVAETEDGPSTLAAAEALRPDIVIMDISLPGMNGIEATRAIKEAWPWMAVIALSIYTHKHYILGMLKAGALSYLPKSCDEEEIIKAVHSVRRGEYYLLPEITSLIADDLVEVTGKRKTRTAAKELSPREIEILVPLAQGKTINQIARSLHISQKTVETHRINISGKLGLKSIAELARYAERTGLIRD